MAVRYTIIPYLFLVLTSFLVLFPILTIVYQSALSAPLYEPAASVTFKKYIEVLSEPKFRMILFNTFMISIIAVIVSIGIGVFTAILVERTDIPFKNFVRIAMIMPLVMPVIVAAVAWTLMFGRNGYITVLLKTLIGFAPWDINTLPGVGLVIGLYYVPYVFLFASSSLSLSNPELEDTARACGAGVTRIILKIVLPLLKPVIFYSGLLIFVISVEQLAIPLILGSPYGVEVLMTYLYEISIRSGLRDWPASAVIAVMILCITSILVFILNKQVGAEKRYISVGGKAIRPNLVSLGAWRIPLFIIVFVYALLTMILPILGIVLRTFTKVFSPLINPLYVLTLSNFDFLTYSEYLMSIPNTIIVAAIGATIGAIYAFYNSSSANRSQIIGRTFLKHISLYPRSMPGLVLGMGFLWMFLLIPPLQLIRNTLLALIIAYIARYIPYGYTTITPAMIRISPELDGAARVSGATWSYVQRKILLPLLKPAMFATWTLLFITFLREYSVAIFLYLPQTRVLGVTILEFWNQGEFGPIAALSLIQLAITFTAFVILQKILKVRVYG